MTPVELGYSVQCLLDRGHTLEEIAERTDNNKINLMEWLQAYYHYKQGIEEGLCPGTSTKSACPPVAKSSFGPIPLDMDDHQVVGGRDSAQQLKPSHDTKR